MIHRVLTTLVLLIVATPGVSSDEAAQAPVIFETLKPAARARIGERGLYTASLARLRKGDLLASAHYGSSELQRISIWRSSDEGRTWKRVQTRGDALFGSGATLKCLQDGTLLLHTGTLYRSTDQGVTWNTMECPDVGTVRSIVEQANGGLLLFGSDSTWYAGLEPPPASLLGLRKSWYREGAEGSLAIRSAWRIRSQDGGRSWSQPEAITNQNVSIRSNTKWADLQPLFREASILPLSRSHLLATTRRSYPEEHVVLMESRDGGLKWADIGRFLPPGAVHPQLLAVNDGRLLCTYALHEVPRGIFGVLSKDQGKTWETDRPIYLTGSLANFFGWPTSLQMPEGTIMTIYTIKGYEETTQINDSVTEVVRWQLPDAGGPAVQSLSEPVFAQPHDFRKYPAAVTGFTGGGNLQQVSYWQLAPSERFHIPGYKGAFARFPDGELLVTPFQDAHTVIYRSTDEGRTWQKVQMKGDKIPGKEQSMICLSDNKTVLLQTEVKGTPLFRSTDRGITWKRIDYGQPTGTTRNFIELSDGSVLMFGSTDGSRQPGSPRTTAWRLRSFDGGLTWPERKEVKTWDSHEGFFGEVFILPFSDTHFLAATRVTGDLARKIANAPPIIIGKGARHETDECMMLMDSYDGGLTWSNFRTFSGYSAVHSQIIKLDDGRLLCVFRRRLLPYGVGAVISEDNGKTWDLDHPIIVGLRPTAYGGWPTSLQLEDGSILTTRAWMSWPDAVFEVTRWKVPPKKGR